MHILKNISKAKPNISLDWIWPVGSLSARSALGGIVGMVTFEYDKALADCSPESLTRIPFAVAVVGGALRLPRQLSWAER